MEVIAPMVAALGLFPMIGWICREIVQVSESLRVLGDTTAERPALPDPVSLWWKAQLLQRWDSERRAATPLDRMQEAELLAGVGGLVLFIRWIWPNLGRLFRPPAAEDVAAWASALSSTGLTPLLLVAGLLAALTAIVTVHALLVED